MSVGFRPTEADNEIIQAHKRPEETTSDVLRRALRALDRQRWESQAREDMERIAAAGEDLSEEPDEWGYDEAGHFVDLRGEQRSTIPVQSEESTGTLISDDSVGQPMFVVDYGAAVEKSRSALATSVKYQGYQNLVASLPKMPLPDSVDIAALSRDLLATQHIASWLVDYPFRSGPDLSHDLRHIRDVISTTREPMSQQAARRAVHSWKLASLRAAAARRAGNR